MSSARRYSVKLGVGEKRSSYLRAAGCVCSGRRAWVLALLWSLAAGFSAPADAAPAPVATAVAEGVAPIRGGNVAVARTVALNDAKRNAVLWAAGAYVDVESMPDHRRVRVTSESQIVSQRILSEEAQGKMYHLLLEADVVLPSAIISSRQDMGVVASAGEPVIQELEDARINWGEGWIEATGRAVSPSTGEISQAALERVAFTDAQGRMLEALKGIRARGRVRIGDAKEKLFLYRLEAFSRGAEAVPGSERREDGRFSLTVRAPLWGVTGLATLYYREVLRSLPAVSRSAATPAATAAAPATAAGPSAVPTATPAAEPSVTTAPQPPEPTPTVADSASATLPAGSYTGLVVDATGTDLRVSLFPSLVDESGDALSSFDTVAEDSLRTVGLASFLLASRAEGGARLLWPARNMLMGLLARLLEAMVAPALAADEAGDLGVFERDGRNPLRLRARGVTGAGNADIVIANGDAQLLARDEAVNELLRQCRLVILVGPTAAE
ncbi:MAG: hypothetical protein HYV63_08325 [Candidatus Schekmanbacteria bacterium]|nr:hypothetical protein [Candidatus Schekmanbacteria bacterium]